MLDALRWGFLLAVLWAAALGAISCAPDAGPRSPDTASPDDPEARFAAERRRMVGQQLRGRDVFDTKILAAMEKIPRHRFVPEARRDRAYDDNPLPIGFGQTISQPYIVGKMTDLLRLKESDRVLEIGTGSGYQAAVLAELTPHVYTLEIIEQLAQRAEGTLRELGYDGVKVGAADGYYGWEEHAPFDAIIVTCAPDHIPQPLVQQLADGGRMVVPVGPPGLYQSLWRIEKRGERIITQNMMGVVFVPMTGAAETE